jgi:hypothetical protein
MNLMADECVDRQIVARLRREGHEVLYVAEKLQEIQPYLKKWVGY